MAHIRKAQVAGTFYPAEKNALKSSIDTMLSQQQSIALKNISGLIAPHAGYLYSGSVAASAYKQIIGRDYETIIVISPSHYDYFKGCSVFTGNYETPLGKINSDNEVINALLASGKVISSQLGHTGEHALEVHLPFLQILLPQFKLVPIVMGVQNFYEAEKLAEVLYNTLSDSHFNTKKYLIISSSDLSHFHDIEMARMLDAVIIKDIEDFDCRRLNENILDEKTKACGYGPILTLMMTCRKLGINRSKVLKYSTSADVNNDFKQVVGYMSAAFYTN